MSSYMKLKSCGRAKTSWYFLKNYSMISTDALHVVFLSSLMIVNEGSSLTIVNETAIFIKTTIFLNELFERRSFRFRFFIIVFKPKRSLLKKLKTLTSLLTFINESQSTQKSAFDSALTSIRIQLSSSKF